MKVERTISAYKNYFRDFISSLTEAEARKVVMLFNGFQKKSQKTPQNEINKAIQLKKEYYAAKR